MADERWTMMIDALRVKNLKSMAAQRDAAQPPKETKVQPGPKGRGCDELS